MKRLTMHRRCFERITSPALFTYALLVLMLASCQNTSAPEAGKTPKAAETFPAGATDAHTDTATPATPVAHGGFTTPPPSSRATVAARNSREPRYDIAVSDQDAREFFMGLMQTTSHNIVVHPEVNGRISLFLQQVTLQEALTAVNDMYGFDYERNDYGYVILPAVMNTRVFAINYLNVERKGSSRTSVSSGEITNTNNEQSDKIGNNTSSTTSSVRDSTTIETSNTNNFWKDLEKMLDMMVDKQRGSLVAINPQAGLVVVRGMPHELRSVDNFLKRAQLSLDRQVVLEAKILEVTLRDGFQAGINWSALAELNSGDNTIGAGLGSAALSNPDLIDGIFGVTVTSNDFNAVIELLQTQGDVSVLSSPRVATVNNQKAAIKVGTDEFFVTNVKTTTTTGTATTQTPEVTLTPFFSGIVLDVTPQIGDQGDVVLHVHPSVSEVVDQKKDIKIGDSDLSLPLALSSIREADSVVRARSQQVVLIGGLMSNNSSDVSAKVPGLANTPGLGWLFTQKRQSHAKSELVILLRPIIADTPPTGWTSEQLRDADAGFTDGPWLKPAR